MRTKVNMKENSEFIFCVVPLRVFRYSYTFRRT